MLGIFFCIVLMIVYYIFLQNVEYYSDKKPVRHEQVELILELLREGKGWTFDSGRNPYFAFHTSGVRIYIGNEADEISIDIQDTEGLYQPGVSISDKDRQEIWKLIKSIINGSKNEYQKSLTYTLAKRILEEREVSGLLGRPELGSSGNTELLGLGVTATREILSHSTTPIQSYFNEVGEYVPKYRIA